MYTHVHLFAVVEALEGGSAAREVVHGFLVVRQVLVVWVGSGSCLHGFVGEGAAIGREGEVDGVVRLDGGGVGVQAGGGGGGTACVDLLRGALISGSEGGVRGRGSELCRLRPRILPSTPLRLVRAAGWCRSFRRRTVLGT